MNKEELKRALDKDRIDSHYYSLNGLDNLLYEGRTILEKGKNGWLVYYYERGEKWDIHVFKTEDEACTFLFNRITQDPNTRIFGRTNP